MAASVGESSAKLVLRNLSDSSAAPVSLDPGVMIGSDPGNAIIVDQPGVREFHARVMRDEDGELHLRAVTGRPIQFQDGSSIWDIVLHPGATVVIGQTTFRCEEAVTHEATPKPNPVDQTEHEPQPSAEALGLVCPTCRRIVATLPVSARYCPRCGSLMPQNRPDLSLFADAMERPARRRRLAWIWPFARRGRGDFAWRLLGRRPGTLIAYVNTLLNLARRYESAPGADKNIRQALRYYEKAAKLGSGEARGRLSEEGDDTPMASRAP